MKKIILLLMFSLFLTSCSSSGSEENTKVTEEITEEQLETDGITEEAAEDFTGPDETITEKLDIEAYFQGITGCAVFYTPDQNSYLIYNSELWEYASSPCSTFKIISAAAGLKHGVIDLSDSVREWNGTSYWNENWNGDIGLHEAFKTSCIWYFRSVIDDLGQETMQAELDLLDYGNADISDWEGILNTSNDFIELRGFWVESSLKISPRNQTEVLARIFEDRSLYNEETVSVLKEIMLTEHDNPDVKIYGKTGFGVKDGRNVDAWFVGMFETAGETVYFAVRLDDPDNLESDSSKAKEIALSLIDDYQIISQAAAE